ncbi:MAG: acetyl/propionyl/methylcrotonyl-CoA carboxylase subunit alpha [Sciscionella sp.]
MFETVLIANRGEIAVRIAATLRRMGIRSIAVYSDADEGARHVRDADVAVRIGPAAAARSYLSIERIVAAALESGAQAVHRGYGVVSENTAFAAACADAGVVFIGPPVKAIEAMGDKIRAKRTVSAAGVPVIPWRADDGLSDVDLAEVVEEIGYPVLLKPSAGGGGKGMRRVERAADLAEAIAAARREATGAFGDDTLLVERFVANPRHIEIQVLADTDGNVIHLGERECSLQRRHQKIVEEAPSPLLDETMRQQMGKAAVDAAAAVGYIGAGTVEFIVSADDPSEFFFMEMNTRLQVEHPVTELVTGIDMVEQQVLVAAGQPLAVTPSISGHAVEVRVYAETVTASGGFLPSGGTVLLLREPDARVRVDSGLRTGTVIGSEYDPMLAKYVAHGASRQDALRTMSAALRESYVLGVGTNIGFLQRLLADSDVLAGRLDTGLVERKLSELVDGGVPEHVLVAAAMERALSLEPADGCTDPWELPGGWRIGEPAWASWQIEAAGNEPVTVRVRGRANGAEVSILDSALDDGREHEPEPATARVDDGDLVVSFRGRSRRYANARQNGVLWLGADGVTWRLSETSRLAAARADLGPGAHGPVTSPMPGTVLLVAVAEGDRVLAGQQLVVVEAMKMEHSITTTVDGTVSELHVRTGQSVRLNEPLAVITPDERPCEEARQ